MSYLTITSTQRLNKIVLGLASGVTQCSLPLSSLLVNLELKQTAERH